MESPNPKHTADVYHPITEPLLAPEPPLEHYAEMQREGTQQRRACFQAGMFIAGFFVFVTWLIAAIVPFAQDQRPRGVEFVFWIANIVMAVLFVVGAFQLVTLVAVGWH